MEYTFYYTKLFDMQETGVVWIPTTVENQIYNPSDTNRLRRQGWRAPTPLSALQAYALASQYSVIRAVIDPTQDENNEADKQQDQMAYGWFHKDNVEHIKKYPVIFLIRTKTDVQPPPGYNKEYGATALFFQNTDPKIVFINQMPQETQELFDQMHKRIEELTLSSSIDQQSVVNEVHRMAKKLAAA